MSVPSCRIGFSMLGVWALALMAPAVAHPRLLDEVQTAETMRRLADAFRVSQAGFEAQDTSAASRGILALAELSSATLEWTQQQPHVERLWREVQSLSHELRMLVEDERLAAAEQAFSDLRNACVSCHVRSRPRVDRVGFPALHNTITGQVNVLRLNGEPRPEVSDIVVFLDGAGPTSPFSLPRGNPVVSQRDREFVPRVLPILKGTTVEFPNDDKVLHNAFSLSSTRPFDLDIYNPGTTRSLVFPRAGLVPIYCHIHPEMRCNIVVLNNPYFTVTDERGRFVISGVPDGSYLLKSWNEYGGQTRDEVVLRNGRLVEFHPALVETRATVDHNNKFGKPYRKKYR